MISVVTFKWEKPGYRSLFTSENVNVLRRMVARNYKGPHRFLCVTDDPRGLDPEVEAVPLWNDFSAVANPTWVSGPSCYRRLKVFSRWFRSVAGERFVILDLDCVVTGDLTPLWDRDEDFLIWRPNHPGIPICASMFMLRAGAREDVWNKFDDVMSPALTSARGFRGSDQAWIRYCLGDDAPGWTSADGVYGYKDDICKGQKPNRANISIEPRLLKQMKPRRAYGALPEDARIVFFPGKPDPWDQEAIANSPWILEHYR